LFVIVALLLAWDIGKMIVGLYRKRVAAMG
jgi:hypothetical protein